MTNLTPATAAIVLTKKGTVSKLIANTLEGCRIYSDRVYYASSGYSKGWTSVKDYSATIMRILKAQGITFGMGNDAPRGGRNGSYITLTNDAHTLLCDLIGGQIQVAA